jgi:hypothetical protein
MLLAHRAIAPQIRQNLGCPDASGLCPAFALMACIVLPDFGRICSTDGGCVRFLLIRSRAVFAKQSLRDR